MTTTRKSRARWLALATAVLVVMLAALFAAVRNLQPPLPAAPPAVAPVAAGPNEMRLAVGRRAYERQNCASCHSIAGRGNPSNPLDGVGTRLDRAAIHDFATGTGNAREALGANLARRKAAALDDPDLYALVDYLAHLR